MNFITRKFLDCNTFHKELRVEGAPYLTSRDLPPSQGDSKALPLQPLIPKPHTLNSKCKHRDPALEGDDIRGGRDQQHVQRLGASPRTTRGPSCGYLMVVLEPLGRSWSHFVGIDCQKLTRSLENRLLKYLHEGPGVAPPSDEGAFLRKRATRQHPP